MSHTAHSGEFYNLKCDFVWEIGKVNWSSAIINTHNQLIHAEILFAGECWPLNA